MMMTVMVVMLMFFACRSLYVLQTVSITRQDTAQAASEGQCHGNSVDHTRAVSYLVWEGEYK